MFLVQAGALRSPCRLRRGMVLFMHCSSTAMMTDASSVSRRKMKNATTLKMSWKATMAAAVCADLQGKWLLGLLVCECAGVDGQSVKCRSAGEACTTLSRASRNARSKHCKHEILTDAAEPAKQPVVRWPGA
eukprot:GHRQ01034056.1.p1 GENE.GHRQ01034056.1~~GHRQ01034056.1.p1  ORF type:complete len:132 (-),score=19.26 GHRQ01034056.1:129-524(-)